MKVIEKLPSRFHRLQSVIGFVDLYDLLEMRQSQQDTQDTLAINGPMSANIPNDERNSILKALIWVREKFTSIGYFSCQLTKVIPHAAGLGGGTSDAAATILGALTLSKIALTTQQKWELVKASGELGADIPVCLAYQLGLGSLFWLDGSGKEGILETLPDLTDTFYILLANPKVELATPLVFAQMTPDDFSKPMQKPVSIEKLTNDAIRAAINLEPKVKNLLELMKEAPYSSMSGTGATCFALATDLALLNHIKQGLEIRPLRKPQILSSDLEKNSRATGVYIKVHEDSERIFDDDMKQKGWFTKRSNEYWSYLGRII